MAPRRDSISLKLTRLNMLASGAAILLAFIAVFGYEVDNFLQTMVSDLSIQAQIIGTNAISPLVFNDRPSEDKTLSALQASPHIEFAAIYTPDGQFFSGYWRDSSVRDQEALPANSTETESQWYRDWHVHLIRPIIFNGKKVGIVYIRSDLTGLTDRVESYAAILGGILILSLVVALFVSRISQRAISEPIGRLADTARAISRDRNYAVRAAPSASHDEVAVLIEAFNEMLSEIQLRDTTLQESERQFRTLADSVPQLAWIAEANGDAVWFNKRFYDFSGTTPEQVVGWGWQSLHDPEMLPAILQRWQHSIDTGEQFEMVFPLRGKDGAFREFLTIVVPVRDRQNRVVRWFGTNTDITEQRRSEEALRRTEKLAATGRLAASIAHEINNPLEALTNLLYLARRNPGNAENYLRVADQELDRIAEITKHTLGFYRDTSTPARVDVSQIVQEVLELYSRRLQFKKIAVRERYGPHTEMVAFPGELRQIFANLLANAIEAVEPQGHIVVKTTRVHDWGQPGRAGVLVSLLDNGCGIERSQTTKIFEPFYTTKKDVGTGLGLWLTQNLVHKHNGYIRLRSKFSSSGGGTVFSVFLPADGAGEKALTVENQRDAAKFPHDAHNANAYEQPASDP